MAVIDLAYIAAMAHVDEADVRAYLDLYHPNTDPNDVPFEAAHDTIVALDGDGLRGAWLDMEPDQEMCRCAAGMGGREHRRGKGCT